MAVLLAMIVFFVPASTRGAVLLEDSFAYPDGPILDVSNGRWIHHSGTTPGQVEVSHGRLVLSGTETEDIHALLAGEPFMSDNSTNVFYVSFSFRFRALPSNGGAYFAHFKDAGTSNFRARIWAFTSGASAGGYRLGISFGSSSVSASLATDLSLNLDYRLVCRLDNQHATARLWLNPATESDPHVTSTDAGDPITLVAWAFRQASGAGEVSIDDLRVGTTFADVLTDVPPAPEPAPAVSVVTYNVAGNGTSDWSTNSAQVQAIGRQLHYLGPDVITFNEIPYPNTWQMANFVTAYLPGYYLATNSGTDGYIRSAIASRFPIVRSQKWLDGASLVPFGYTNEPARFTRDLFEATVSVPGFDQLLHVFTTHLKAGQDETDFARRAAEASAISNFLVTTFLPGNAADPYVLTGDLNEDVLRPPTGSLAPLARLANAATGLELTTPRSPFNNDDRTISSRSLFARYDYILPGGMLVSNLLSSQVFRTDLLNPLPDGLQIDDSQTASDHLPVLMKFRNPFDNPYELTVITVSNQWITLTWDTVPGRHYRLESSTNLGDWVPCSTNLTAAGSGLSWGTNAKQ